MAGYGIKSTIAGALMAATAAFTPAAAQDTATTAMSSMTPEEAGTMLAPEIFPVATREEARLASQGGIVLHIGTNFSGTLARGAVGALEQRGYNKVSVYSGGPEDKMTLCLDGGCADVDLSEQEAVSYLLDIVEAHAAHLKTQVTSMLLDNN